MRTKPTKWGLKFFVLVDVNGYTVDFSLYQGKSTAASGNGLYDVVTSLVNKDCLGSGYIIHCDNFYTSHVLFPYSGLAMEGRCFYAHRTLVTKVFHSMDQGAQPSLCKVDEYKIIFHLYKCLFSLQRGDSGLLAEDRGWERPSMHCMEGIEIPCCPMHCFV
ncbi:hypothetical protein CCH79_00011516, partial [Gambusia affinis]